MEGEEPKRWTQAPVPKIEEKLPLPEVLKPSIDKAEARTRKRSHGPIVEMKRTADNSAWEWPFEEGDWRWLVLDALGTRNEAVACVFLNQLLQLCSADERDDDLHQWVPDTHELTQLLHIVAAHKPKNEAQAALAAQMAAAHVLAMRLGARAFRYEHDTRTAAAFGKMARTSVMLSDAIGRAKGKRSTRQTIKVEKRVYVDNRQVHLHKEGGEEAESQPQGANELRARARPAQVIEGSATLPCQDAPGNGVPLPRHEGQGALPDSRRQKHRGAEG